MAPKKKKSKDAKDSKASLDGIKVSDKELQEAKQTLKDADIKRRANSNMMYWLQTTGKRDDYDNISPQERKEFALRWFAWSLNERETYRSTKRSIGTTKKEVDKGT